MRRSATVTVFVLMAPKVSRTFPVLLAGMGAGVTNFGGGKRLRIVGRAWKLDDELHSLRVFSALILA
ncbi:MAG TPA: hypothetical protein VNZ64_06225 [Candidatus Acidoferrum sp.]|nr:hypothetical protein [Candidatus Acidoferrum sp.]